MATLNSFFSHRFSKRKLRKKAGRTSTRKPAHRSFCYPRTRYVNLSSQRIGQLNLGLVLGEALLFVRL
jgi:hypothetical protein